MYDNNTNQTSFKVAAIQFEPKLGKLEHNRRLIAEQASRAAQQGAKLIVFPEMATSGYVWNDRQEISPYVEPVPGETTNILCDIATKYNCYIVIGLPEIDLSTKIYYNTAVLVGPEGVVGCYRKTHLFAADPRWAREGKEEIPVFNTSIGRIALLICMDAMYFEPTRIAALKKADIIAFPTNWVGQGNNPPSKTWCLRAKENGLYWIAANRWGVERGAQFTGGSAVIGPSGDVINSLITGDGIVFSEVNFSENRVEFMLKHRRPEAYQDILLNPYLWKEGETRPLCNNESFDIISIPIDQFNPSILSGDYFQSIFKNITFTSDHRLVVLPQFSFQKDGEVREFLNILEDISLKYNIYIVVSTKQESANPIASMSFIISPEGILGKYSQVHTEENLTFKKSAFVTVKLPFARVGLLTGEDAHIPESYRVLAKQGADVIAISSSNQGNFESWMQRIWAFENDAILAIAVPQEKSMIFLHGQISLNIYEKSIPLLMQKFTSDMLKKVKNRPFLKRLNHHLYDLLLVESKSFVRKKVCNH